MFLAVRFAGSGGHGEQELNGRFREIGDA